MVHCFMLLPLIIIFISLILLTTARLTDPIDLGGAVPSSPVVGSDGVYVGSFASTVEFIQSNGNHEVIATAENWIWGSPVLDGETLYYADLDGKSLFT